MSLLIIYLISSNLWYYIFYPFLFRTKLSAFANFAFDLQAECTCNEKIKSGCLWHDFRWGVHILCHLWPLIILFDISILFVKLTKKILKRMLNILSVTTNVNLIKIQKKLALGEPIFTPKQKISDPQIEEAKCTEFKDKES